MNVRLKKALLLKELEQLEEPLLDEIWTFLRFLQFRQTKEATSTNLIQLASESVLAKDWNRPEEDEAWKDL